jgi:hypothetical protein
MMQAVSVSPRSFWRWFALGLALCCSSCGVKYNPVQGKVTPYQGKIPVGAVVTFNPQGEKDPNAHTPTGVVKEDGTFTVTTGKKEGAPAGSYVVTLTWPQFKNPGSDPHVAQRPVESSDGFRGAFASREKSKFKVEIKDGPNDLETLTLK